MPSNEDTGRPRNSVRNCVRLADEHAVALPTDFERTRLRRRKDHALTGRKNRHDADRRSRLTVRKSGDDMKSIMRGRVIGDARYPSKLDALGLNRTQAISMGSRHRNKSE